VLKSSNVTVDTKVLKTIINEITSITNTNTNTNTYTKIYTSKGIIDNYYDDDNDITCIGTKFSDYNHHTNNNINVDINTNTNTNTISNIEVLGQLIYTYYFFYFLIAGIILLVAMVGAIVLTLNFKQKAKHQFVFKQILREKKNSIYFIK
jgi:hypothetical protein